MSGVLCMSLLLISGVGHSPIEGYWKVESTSDSGKLDPNFPVHTIFVDGKMLTIYNHEVVVESKYVIKSPTELEYTAVFKNEKAVNGVPAGPAKRSFKIENDTLTLNGAKLSRVKCGETILNPKSRLPGYWQCTSSIDSKGEALEHDMLKPLKMIFVDGFGFVLYQQEVISIGTYSRAESDAGSKIDFKVLYADSRAERSNSNGVKLGLYKIEGDTLVLTSSADSHLIRPETYEPVKGFTMNRFSRIQFK